MAPTVTPTTAPTVLPTKPPSFTGTPATNFVEPITLTLVGVEGPIGRADWRNVTETWYADFYERTEPVRMRRLQRLASAGLAQLTTDITILDEQVETASDGTPVTTLTYEQKLEYLVIDEEILRSPRELVQIPFARPADNADYVRRLQEVDPVLYADLQSPVPPTVGGSGGGGGGDDGLGTGVIAGIAVGGAVGLALLIYAGSKMANRDPSSNSSQPHSQFGGFSTQDDVSTLQEGVNHNTNTRTGQMDSASLMEGYGDQRYVQSYLRFERIP